MEPTVWRFLLFLGSELLLIIAALASALVVGILVIKAQALKSGHMLLTSIWLSIVSPLFLFLFIWILTGKSFFLLFSLLAVVSIVMALLVELVLFVTAPNAKWVGQLLWTGFEFDKMVPSVNKAAQIVGLLGLVAYPAYIGYGYFGELFEAENWPQYVMRATLLLLFGCWALQVPKLLYVMMSPNITEEARSRIFLAQTGGAVSVLLLISVYIWTIRGSGTNLAVLGEHFVFSSTVAYATGAYLLLVLIPYLIGYYRSKAWLQQISSERGELIDKLSNGLSAPDPANAAKALEAGQQDVNSALAQLIRDKTFELARETLDSDAPTKLLNRLALQEVERQDPRFDHARRLEEIMDRLEDCKRELAGKATRKEQRELLDEYIKSLDKLKQTQKSPAPTNTFIIAGLTVMGTAILNPFLTSLVKFVVDQVFGSEAIPGPS